MSFDDTFLLVLFIDFNASCIIKRSRNQVHSLYSYISVCQRYCSIQNYINKFLANKTDYGSLLFVSETNSSICIVSENVSVQVKGNESKQWISSSQYDLSKKQRPCDSAVIFSHSINNVIIGCLYNLITLKYFKLISVIKKIIFNNIILKIIYLLLHVFYHDMFKSLNFIVQTTKIK